LYLLLSLLFFGGIAMKKNQVRLCGVVGWSAFAVSLLAQQITTGVMGTGNLAGAMALGGRYFSGIVSNSAGQPMSGIVRMIFSVYPEKEGGSPLWTESQNVQLDEQGRYTVLLGSSRRDAPAPDPSGAGRMLWLGIQAQIPGWPEQPRVFLGGAQDAQASVDVPQSSSPSTVAPVVTFFNIAPTSTLPGQAAIGTLLISGATSATVNGIIANCSGGQCGGTFLFYPTATTDYLLQASGAGGNVSASQQVVVGQYQPNPPPIPAGLQVTWQSACWLKNYPKSFCNGACQGMTFNVNVPTPPSQLPLEATLYLGSTKCSPSQQDNLNDLGTLTGSGGWTFWFTNHPNQRRSSAIWTIGNQSSGCVSYANAPACP
jgi:hypothetical protein